MSSVSDSEVLVFDDFYIDPRQRRLFGPEGRPVPLTGRAFDTLLYLAEHPNQLIDKQALLKAVWPNVIVEENNLNQNISIVRRALGETPGEHRFVVTVPGRGFRFVPTVTRQAPPAQRAAEPPSPAAEPAAAPLAAPTPAPADLAQATAPSPAAAAPPSGDALAAAPGSRMRPWWISGAVAGALVLVLLGYLLARHLAPGSQPVAGAKTSIAVMPFANLTGDPANDYLGDGMAEEIIDTLTKVPGIKVPARTSSFAYKGRDTDIRQIGRDLGVDAVLEGSVRSAGEHIRITAQLINARDGLHIWSQSYDRKFTDVFALQDELAHTIVRTLRGPADQRAPSESNRGPPTRDPEAFGLYLQARLVYRRLTEDSLRKALELSDQALARDPNFARALAERARIRNAFSVFGYPMPHAMEDAEKDANRALALESNLPLAHDVLGVIAALKGDWAQAEANLRAAKAGDPFNPDIRVDHVVMVLDSAGRLRQAQSEMVEAFRLAPADKNVASTLAGSYSILGQDAEAVRVADLAVDLGFTPTVSPIPGVYANAAMNAGRFQEGAERVAGALPAVLRDAGGADAIRLIYAARADSKKRAAAQDSLRALVRRVGPKNLTSVTRKMLIVGFADVGALDDAYQLVNDAVDEYMRDGSVGSAWGALWLPDMSSFRQDPRFQALVTRLKLMDYWKQYGPPDACTLQGEKLSCH